MRYFFRISRQLYDIHRLYNQRLGAEIIISKVLISKQNNTILKLHSTTIPCIRYLLNVCSWFHDFLKIPSNGSLFSESNCPNWISLISKKKIILWTEMEKNNPGRKVRDAGSWWDWSKYLPQLVQFSDVLQSRHSHIMNCRSMPYRH